MYNLRPRLKRVNYRTLSCFNLLFSAVTMTAHESPSETSGRDTEESTILSDQDPENIEELEALIVQEQAKLASAKKKALKQKLKDLKQATYLEQHQLDRKHSTSCGEHGSTTMKDEQQTKAVSSRDLREFEDLSQAVEKRLSKMGLAASALLSLRMILRVQKTVTLTPGWSENLGEHEVSAA